jgi:hypothetical protein
MVMLKTIGFLILFAAILLVALGVHFGLQMSGCG